jgi:hypothetical protein
MSKYFSLDDIIAGEERVPVNWRAAAARVGFLDASVSTEVCYACMLQTRLRFVSVQARRVPSLARVRQCQGQTVAHIAPSPLRRMWPRARAWSCPCGSPRSCT